MYYNDFVGWVREQLDAGPYSDDTDAARKLGVPPSTVTRWLYVRYPTRATTRQVATLFDVPIHEVLVAGGYMTPDEATIVTVEPSDLCASPCSHTHNTATPSPNPLCSDSSPSPASSKNASPDAKPQSSLPPHYDPTPT